MLEPTTELIMAPGAQLYFEKRGAGRPLLVLQGGPHDADGARGLADRLAGPDFTVIGMDRRGQVRSPKLDPESNVTVAIHAADALAVLDEVSAEPAVVLGTSMGAVIGLEMMAQRPDRIRLLVAHEPPLPELLTDAERVELAGFQDALDATYRRDGALAAMGMFVRALDVDPRNREAGVAMPAQGPRMAANAEAFLRFDTAAVRTYRIQLDELRGVSSRIVPAVGADSRRTRHAVGAVALAEALGVALVEMPGGHGGYGTHPAAFAEKLRALVD
jgi:pimeloyl-ACP methyl ester carboxylesterase